MNWDRLEAFRAVALEGGFSRAAAVLRRTQPAVSQAVAALERDLGEALFVRAGRHTRLTAAGELLLEQVERAFAALRVAEQELAALRELRTGVLRLGTSDTSACYVLPPVFARYRERYPNLELELETQPSPRVAALVESGRLDVGFITLPHESPALVTEKLVTREDVVICAASHPLGARHAVRLEALVAHPLLLLHRGTSTRAFLDRAFERLGLKPRVALETGSIEVLKRLVALDFGVSIVPRIAVERELSAGELVALRAFPKQAFRGLGVATLRRAPLAPAARAFVELAREVLSRDAIEPRSAPH
jgi:DNA-binding transcriptional LysR family regulator